MALQRLSHLQKRILAWLEADWQRTKGASTSSHHDLAKALSDVDKSNLSHSLQNLADKRYIEIIRTEGGLAESIIFNKVVIKD